MYKHLRICINPSCEGENECKKVHIEVDDIEDYKVQGFIPYKQDWQKIIDCRYLKDEGLCKNGRGCNYRHNYAEIVDGQCVRIENRINEEEHLG